MTALRISELVGGVIGFEDFLDPFAALDEVGFGGVIDAGAEAFVDFIGDALEMKASEALGVRGRSARAAHEDDEAVHITIRAGAVAEHHTAETGEVFALQVAAHGGDGSVFA